MRLVEAATRALNEFGERSHAGMADVFELVSPVRQLEEAQRDLLPPVIRVQAALHPWVAFGVMPLFALANAGVSIEGADFSRASLSVLAGVALALILGKPVGILLGSWLAVRSGLSRLPPWGHLAGDVGGRLPRWHRLHDVDFHRHAGF